MRRTLHRRDGNHAELEAALRRVTVVHDVHNYALGCDLIARHALTRGPVFIEIKDPKQPPSGRTLTDSEKAMKAEYGRFYFVVETIDDALAAVGITGER